MEKPTELSVNEHNKPFIDVFMNRFYPGLAAKFRINDLTINSRSTSSMDILHDTILGIYSDPINFASQVEANKALHIKFRMYCLTNQPRRLRKKVEAE